MTQQDDPYPLAIKLLARREHAARELERKLRDKGFDAAAVQGCIARLQRERLQSDERFTEVYVSSRTGRGYGPLRIRAELAERGVDDEIVQRHLDASAEQWRRLADEARRKRFGARLPQDYQERARQARFLQYRGFSGEQLRGLFKDEEF